MPFSHRVFAGHATSSLHSRMPPQIPLFYSLPLGKDQVADTWFIIMIPLISFICISVNNLVNKYIIDRNDFTDNVTDIANIVVIAICTYIFIKIIFLVAL